MHVRQAFCAQCRTCFVRAVETRGAVRERSAVPFARNHAVLCVGDVASNH
jgi:hypothetical protein